MGAAVETEGSGCCACLGRRYLPTPGALRKQSTLPFSPSLNTASSAFTPVACVAELESLLSASERKTARAVFGYLTKLEGNEASNSVPVPGIHDDWNMEEMAREGIGISTDSLERYLQVPESLSRHFLSCFRDHSNHFHPGQVPKELDPNTVSYHAFLHTVVPLALLDPTDSKALLPVLDLFCHSKCVAEGGEGSAADEEDERPDTAETAWEADKDRPEEASKGTDAAFLATTMSLAQLQANNEHVYKVVRERTKQGKPYSRRKASMSFVVAADKTITEKPEDEKLFLTHGDVVKLLEFFAWFATSKYLLLESLFGKKVPERGRAEDRRMSYSSWKASRGYGGRDSTATTWSKLAVPDAAEHVRRKTAVRTADQIFRYAGKAGLVINESGDFQAHEQITVTELKIWLSSQGQNLFVPVVSFMRDRFLSLQFLPFELVRDLEERMNKAQTDGQMDPSDLVSPVIDLMPELTIPATICDIRGKLLRPHHAWLLNNVIPPRVARSVAKAQGKPVQALWSLLYSASEIGFSTQMFEKAVCGYLGSTMLLVSGKAIKDQTLGTPFVEQITLGAYIPRPWNAFGNTFGSEESKVFELEPFFEVFNSTMQLLDFARYSPQTGVSFGGHNEETARIRLDRDFRFGTYQQRPIRHNLSTYAYSRTRTGNRLKDFSVAFEILDIEIWALEGADARKLIEEADPLARARKAAANKVLHESEEEVVEHEEIDWDLMKQLDQLEPRKA